MKGPLRNKGTVSLKFDHNNPWYERNIKYKLLDQVHPPKIKSNFKVLMNVKDLFPDFIIISVSLISRYQCKNLESKILAYSDFALASCEK